MKVLQDSPFANLAFQGWTPDWAADSMVEYWSYQKHSGLLCVRPPIWKVKLIIISWITKETILVYEKWTCLVSFFMTIYLHIYTYLGIVCLDIRICHISFIIWSAPTASLHSADHNFIERIKINISGAIKTLTQDKQMYMVGNIILYG